MMKKTILSFAVITCFTMSAFSNSQAHPALECPPLFPTSKESTEINSHIVKMVLDSNQLQRSKSIKLDLDKARQILKEHEQGKFVWHKIQKEHNGKMRCGFSFLPVKADSPVEPIIVLMED